MEMGGFYVQYVGIKRNITKLHIVRNRMINKNTIKIINEEIDKGNRFFYFDLGSMKLRTSKPDNKGSFYDLDVADCLEIYLNKHTTEEYINSVFKFYNKLYR